MRKFIIAILISAICCVSCASRRQSSMERTAEHSPLGKAFLIQTASGLLRNGNWYLVFANDSLLNIVYYNYDGLITGCNTLKYRQINCNTYVFKCPGFWGRTIDTDTLYYYANLGMIASKDITFIDRDVYKKYVATDTVRNKRPILFPDQLDTCDISKNTHSIQTFKKNWLLNNIIFGSISDIPLEYYFSDSSHRNIKLTIGNHLLKVVCTSDLFDPVIEEYKCVNIGNSIHILEIVRTNRDTCSIQDVVPPFANTDKLTPTTAFPRFEEIGMYLETSRTLHDVLNYKEFLFTRKKEDKFEKAKLEMRPINIGYEFYVNGKLHDTIPNTAELKRLYPDYEGSGEFFKMARWRIFPRLP